MATMSGCDGLQATLSECLKLPTEAEQLQNSV
jgi:hypothetical protein